ncbi:Sec-independent protein translocase protein TatC [Brevibacillus reuszeri]|uniref:Sec-independent protein translocase protein TatC n=1 Tax=Brevibacillus reuszeri TaxID=54915 RepID=A0A0K9YVY5_9BACL|nr:twin-arginine translocase subunit TatC [Brevibacillus reuszeri]KNB72874.1 preprotein translocase subunit TatC [Brevibacillus reuszeri]MED1861767.1 twin-arginine translocase subunit TatC [Brevibacillus reuszeri]GED72779.1 Sec-independent protein translocase protein TatC [Brevibacillus reuszeri]
MKRKKKIAVFNHLVELRKRIVWVILVFVLMFMVGLYFAGPIIEYLKVKPMADGVPVISLHPSDALRVYMQFAALVGGLGTLPVALYHMWKFVSKGLSEKERRAAFFFIPAAFFLFVIGILFGYYIIFSMMMQFLADLSHNMGITTKYGIGSYFDFMFQLVVPIGVLFELPIVVMFLTRLRIINPKFLSKMRRFAYFGIVVVTFILTPPELVTEILTTIPLLLLYELSIWLSKIIYRKQQMEDAMLDTENEPMVSS